jgi:ribose transport system ATP-binding protein
VTSEPIAAPPTAAQGTPGSPGAPRAGGPGIVLEVRGLSKSFPGQRALTGVDLDVRAGQIHALVGQNGSGKSTLIKVLAGVHAADPGAAVTVGGEPLRLGVPGAGHQLGLRFVHQDLGLVPGLSVIDNLALGRGYGTGRLGQIRWRAEARQARAALADVDVHVDVYAAVSTLSTAERTGLAIARAVHDDEPEAEPTGDVVARAARRVAPRAGERATQVLVLDEPTAALPAADVDRLFGILRRLRDRGVGVVLVSHDLDEVLDVADHVSVLRDGRLVASVPRSGLDHDRLVELIVGRAAAVAATRVARNGTGTACLQADGLAGGALAAASFAVGRGEIVGVAGLEGSGRESLVPLLTGQLPRRAGAVWVGDRGVPSGAPDRALRAGMAFVPRERQAAGVFAAMNVRENLTIAGLRRFVSFGRIRRRAEAAETAGWIERLGVVTTGPEAVIGSLSGGNQQKVLLGRSLRLGPRVLVLDEPTQGVDVGARVDVHRIIDEAAARGAGVVVASTDSDELVRLAHRVLVLQQGRVVRTLHRDDDLSVDELNHAQLARTAGGDRP